MSKVQKYTKYNKINKNSENFSWGKLTAGGEVPSNPVSCGTDSS